MTAKTATYATASDGLAAELAMLEMVASGHKPAFMIWQSASRALTLPERFTRSAGYATGSQQLAEQGWPVIARRTGGGITPQGPGILNVALAFRVPPRDAKSVPESYAAICDPLIATFSDLGVSARPGSVTGSFCDGDYNLEVGGRKLVGTAQRWRGPNVLCHALIVLDVDLMSAVSAAQHLSDALDLGDTYNVDAHVCLKDLISIPSSMNQTFCEDLSKHLMADGFEPA